MSSTHTTSDNPRASRWALDGPCKDGTRLKDHLKAVHAEAPGFTQACASACLNNQGQSSYEWLCAASAPRPGDAVLDLACGSGVLLDLCRERYGSAVRLTGVDMSAEELEQARARLSGSGVTLHEGFAQSLDFAADKAFRAVLCHWALTLMMPIEPVLREIDRVLMPGGVFAAIVDGPEAEAEGYTAVSEIIGRHVHRSRPQYSELGDPRVRDGKALTALVRTQMPDAKIGLQTQVFLMQNDPEILAADASGFYYSAFVLSAPERDDMLKDLAAYFARQASPYFAMPVSRLVVHKPA